ncbi:BnaCnng50500D, partial [Brassica napus]
YVFVRPKRTIFSSFEDLRVLILSLFFLPTLLAVHTFTNCSPVFGGIRVTGSKEFVEQGRKSFNLTCSTVLTKGFILAVVKRGFAMGPILNIQPYNLCDLITCPVSPGSFVITFRKLYPVPITWHIDTSIVLDAGPGKIVNGVTVPADGSMCANISDWYFRNRGGP